MKLTKKNPVQIEMPIYMEDVGGNPYIACVWGIVIPSEPKPQYIINAISVHSGAVIQFEELLARRSLMYPGEPMYRLEKEIYDMMLDCAENDY